MRDAVVAGRRLAERWIRREDFGEAFANDDAGRLGVARGDGRHDRAVGDAQFFRPVDPELASTTERSSCPTLAVQVGWSVTSPRRGSGCLLPRPRDSRQDLALDEGLHGLGISELAGDLHAPAQGREVAGVSQHVGVDFRRLARAADFSRRKPRLSGRARPGLMDQTFSTACAQ